MDSKNISLDLDNEKKRRVARLSVISNASLVIVKLIAGLLSGSIGILSEAIHSGIDLVASAIAYLSVKKSACPPDECHAFGHGKYEDVSGLAEALLIFVAAVIIILEATDRLIIGPSIHSEELLTLGILVMLLSAVVNWFVSAKLFEVGRETGSIAIESDGWHLRTDVYTSAGVFLGLLVMKVTGIFAIDSVIAIVIAFVIIHTAWDLTKRSFSDLVDRSLPESDEEKIRQIILSYCGENESFHALKTRRSGPDRYVDFHMTVPPEMSVRDAHRLADEIEMRLKSEFLRIYISIHIEPFQGDKGLCEGGK
ncbi:cation transporter [Methanoplanus sp. FWC-SCC4]|uniref:Cation transporter n=1 Tax=Methanochimaera problematica TaxID=2609417 RepID=A0AA97FFB1_9EURY|nr:cation diffusion facilitator family transporter [Methanoplanus sp. FWC-SCC4]WOF16973.1 cation transporter [Methanoplanus sp. FWC-SCC4]